MGVFFWSIYSSLAWAAFGFFLGLLITHGIVEIIYHFDFRKLLAHPVHIGICAVLALAGIGLFRYDLFGYDRIFPRSRSSYRLRFPAADFMTGSITTSRVEDGSYSWQYMNEDDYVAANMGLTDYALVKAFAEQGIANAAKEKDARMKNLWNWDQGGRLLGQRRGGIRKERRKPRLPQLQREPYSAGRNHGFDLWIRGI